MTTARSILALAADLFLGLHRNERHHCGYRSTGKRDYDRHTAVCPWARLGGGEG